MKYNWKRFIIETLYGKTIGRILFNREVFKKNNFLSGKVLDIGSGTNPSYEKYLDKKKFVKIKTTKYEKDFYESDGNEEILCALDYGEITFVKDKTIF